MWSVWCVLPCLGVSSAGLGLSPGFWSALVTFGRAKLSPLPEGTVDVSTCKAVISSGDRSLPQITNQYAWTITLFTDSQTVVVELPRSYKVFFLFVFWFCF